MLRTVSLSVENLWKSGIAHCWCSLLSLKFRIEVKTSPLRLKVLLTLPEQLAREEMDVKANKNHEIRGIHPTEFLWITDYLWWLVSVLAPKRQQCQQWRLHFYCHVSCLRRFDKQLILTRESCVKEKSDDIYSYIFILNYLEDWIVDQWTKFF